MRKIIISTALSLIGMVTFFTFGSAYIQYDFATGYLVPAAIGLALMVAGVVIEEVL